MMHLANCLRLRAVLAFCMGLLVLAFAQAARADAPEYAVGERRATFIDETRPVKATMGFAGAPARRIDVAIWYPAVRRPQRRGAGSTVAAAGRWPLVIYSHGTLGKPDDNMHLVNELVRHGYVVAAPTYPLSSRVAFTGIRMADISDVAEQTRDVRFVIDRLLADPFTGPMIDPARIGATGHSLGGVTTYFDVFGVQTRDPRIKAAAMIGAGDPVQTALSGNMGLWGTAHSAQPVPALFLSADKDVFARTTGRPHAAYSRVTAPKYEVLIRGGVHVWFRDGNEQPPGNKNPDCLFFEKHMPGVQMPGCEERVPLIGAARQQEIARATLRAFFDAYLKQDAAGLARLRDIARDYPEAEILRED